jgi:hypothetical protein
MTPRPSANARRAAALLAILASTALADDPAAAPAAPPPVPTRSLPGPGAAPAPVTGPAHAVAAAPSTAGDQARFLAGLPVAPTSPLFALEQKQDWKDHEGAMARAWPVLATRLEKAAAFEASALAPLIQRDRKVIYFFGGPDAAHVVKVFPEAPAYLLAGLESVGAVEPPETMRPAEWHAAIDGLASALRTFVEKSFFRTSEMGHDLQGKGIKGVQPVLYLFLARSGAEVLDATSFEVNAAGVAADKAPGEKWGPGVPGVRIRFQFPGKPVQSMSYVRVNLFDEELARQPGFLAWARGFGPANGFLKAASFILHDKNFSKPRAFLLETCAAILQDDSGVPYRVYRNTGRWALTCFGPYARPRDPFQGSEQKDLAEACGAQPARPLDFIIGYRRQNDTALQLYVKQPGAAAGGSAAALDPTPAQAAHLIRPTSSAVAPMTTTVPGPELSVPPARGHPPTRPPAETPAPSAPPLHPPTRPAAEPPSSPLHPPTHPGPETSATPAGPAPAVLQPSAASLVPPAAPVSPAPPSR